MSINYKKRTRSLKFVFVFSSVWFSRLVASIVFFFINANEFAFLLVIVCPSSFQHQVDRMQGSRLLICRRCHMVAALSASRSIMIFILASTHTTDDGILGYPPHFLARGSEWLLCHLIELESILVLAWFKHQLSEWRFRKINH
jgi:hypothetical protein